MQMNHSQHAMTTAMTGMTMHHLHNGSMNMNGSTTPMDHSGHNMSSVDHSGHDMSSIDDSGHGMDHGSNATDHSQHGSGHTMQMYFHTGVSEVLLFENLQTMDKGGMVGACFVLFLLSVLYEGLKYFREYLLRRNAVRSNVYAPSTTNNGDAIAHKQPEVGTRMLSGSHGLQTVLHMVQVFVSYCLMLVFMTYNVWLCLSIILGAGCGYFLFGWRRAMVVDLNEHCH